MRVSQTWLHIWTRQGELFKNADPWAPPLPPPNKNLGICSLNNSLTAAILTPKWKAESLRRNRGDGKECILRTEYRKRTYRTFSLHSTKQISQVFDLPTGKSMSSPQLDRFVRKTRWIHSDGTPLTTVTPTYITLKGSRPKIFCFSILIVLSQRHLKNSKCGDRLSLNSLYLSKDRSSKRNSVVISLPTPNPTPPRSFISQGWSTLFAGEGTGS